MAEDSQKGPQEPNLELPSLFGRGRKKKQQKAAAPAEPAPDVAADDAAGEAPATPALVPTTGSGRRPPPSAPPPSTPPPSAPPTAAPPAAGTPATAPATTGPAPTEPSTTEQPAAPAASASPPVAAPRTPAPAARRVPPPRTVPDPPAESPASRGEPTPTVGTSGASAPAAATTPTATGPDFAYDTPEPAGATTLTEPDPELEPHPESEAPKEKRARRRPAMPSLSVGHPLLAAAVAGLVAGAVGVVLLWLVGRSCAAVRGVDSCGGGLGLLALLAAAAVEVILGAVLLKGQQLSDPTSTSFLGVGMVAVVALALFFGALNSGWMFVVLPLLTAVTFVIAFLVTTTFVEDPGS